MAWQIKKMGSATQVSQEITDLPDGGGIHGIQLSAVKKAIVEQIAILQRNYDQTPHPVRAEKAIDVEVDAKGTIADGESVGWVSITITRVFIDPAVRAAAAAKKK